MTTEHVAELIAPHDFDALTWPARCSVFRLETLQTYAGSGEDEALAAFERGDDVPPPDPDADAWWARMRELHAAGRRFERVHVVVEPLTDYLRYEIAWSYPRSVDAGEDVRIVPIGPGRPELCGWPINAPAQDFWLFDADTAPQMLWAEYDRSNRWLGCRREVAPAAIRVAQSWRRFVLAKSVSWAEYVTSAPDLADRVAALRAARTTTA